MGLLTGGPTFLQPAGGSPPATGYVLDEVSSGHPEVPSVATRLDVFWRPDGTRVYTARQGAEMAQNDVSPAWGIQPGDWTNRVSAGGVTNLRSIWWSPSGNELFACVRVPSNFFRIIVWDQSATPYDLTVLGAATNKLFSPGAAGGPQDHVWSADGLRCWVHYPSNTLPAGTSAVLEYVGTIPFDPVSLGAAFVASFDFFPDAGSNLHTFAFSPDGTKMYGMDGQFLVSWDLSPAFDITGTSNFVTGPTVAAGTLSIPRGIHARPDNTDITIAGDQGSFSMNVAWFREP